MNSLKTKHNRVTVSMSLRRWNRMLKLEETYKLARIIKRSMKQVESDQVCLQTMPDARWNMERDGCRGVAE